MSCTNQSVNTVGDLLKFLRNKKGITQSFLAQELGYTVRQVRRYENNELELSISAIEILSNYYNIDLFNYISVIKKYGSIEVFDEYTSFRKIIESQDFKLIREKRNLLSNDPKFQSDNKLQLIHYSSAILLSYEEKKFKKSLEICHKGLKVSDNLDYINNLETQVLSEMDYPLLFLIGYNYLQLEETDLYYKLTLALYEHFNKFVFNNNTISNFDLTYMKKYHLAATNNLAYLYFGLELYDKSLQKINEGISLSNTYKISIVISYLLHTKLQCLYMLKNYEESKSCYKLFKDTCEINGLISYFDAVYDGLKNKYPLLFVE